MELTHRFVLGCWGRPALDERPIGRACRRASCRRLVHGFLSLSSPEGAMLAHGDLIRDARGGRANSRLVYHFSDGSLQDETAVSSQRGSIQLMSDHFVRKSPTFERPRAMTIDRPTGHVVVRDKNEHGGEKVEDEHMELPPALANGPIITVLKNVRCDALPPSVSLIVGTPKPRS